MLCVFVLVSMYSVGNRVVGRARRGGSVRGFDVSVTRAAAEEFYLRLNLSVGVEELGRCLKRGFAEVTKRSEGVLVAAFLEKPTR